MPDYPLLAVGIITYNRFKELIKVLDSIHHHLIYPPDRLVWVLSDDGSPGNYVNDIRDLYHFDKVIVHQRGGMPVNWNGMIKACQQYAEFQLCLQDDFVFTAPVDLRIAVRFLEAFPRYGMIRYHKLTGHTGLPLVMQEWDTREAFPGSRFGNDNEYAPHMLPYVEVLPPFSGSNVYSPYSGGVHLRHNRFTQMYGEYTERVGFSNAELEFMTRVNERIREDLNTAQRVAMFPGFIESRFKDIGTSYRDTETEKETVHP